MRLFEVIGAEEVAELWQMVSNSVAQSLHAQLQQQAREREANRLRKATGRRPVRAIKVRAPAAQKQVPVKLADKSSGGNEKRAERSSQPRSLAPIKSRGTAPANVPTI